MNMPTLENYGNYPNTQLVTIFGVDVYFSYKTAIAFRVGGRLVVHENDWGPTTGKHLNCIDGGNKANRYQRVSGSEFESLWKQLSASVRVPSCVVRQKKQDDAEAGFFK